MAGNRSSGSVNPCSESIRDVGTAGRLISHAKGRAYSSVNPVMVTFLDFDTRFGESVQYIDETLAFRASVGGDDHHRLGVGELALST